MTKSSHVLRNASGFVRKTERATRVAIALAGAALTVLAGVAGLSNIGRPLVRLSYDMPFIFHQEGGADKVRMVYLSELEEDSLDRRPQAKLLDRLAEAGARIVVYDLIFDRPSTDPAVDQEFATAMRRFRGVDEEGNPIPGATRRTILLGCGRDTSRKTGYAMETLVVPNDTLLDAADDFGVVAFEDDAFMIRKLTTGTPDEPSIAWKAAQAAGAGLDENSRMDARWFNFAGRPPRRDAVNEPMPIQAVAASSVLEGGSPSLFRDKIVVIGGQPGIVGEQLGKDLFETPYHRFPVTREIPLMSGVEVQANAIANLLNRTWLVRSGDSFDLSLVVIAGLGIGGLLSLLRPAHSMVVAGLLVLVAMVAGWATIRFGYFWFPWAVTAFLQIPTALIWGLGSNTYVERYLRLKLSAEQLAIRQAFEKYLSPQMLDRLTREGFNTRLGGEKTHAAMMFTDLEDFTVMCERIRDPEKIVETLNGYFERTTVSIFEHDGVIIKYIGDAIFAAWGVPILDPDAARKAVRAAWKLFESDRLNVEGREHRTRIGLHFGEVVAGNIGSARRVDYTLIGDSVNLAARLEGVNKMLGTNILLSGEIRQAIGDDFRTRWVGDFVVKGRDEPVSIHELLGPTREEREPEWISCYHGAIAAMKAGDMETALREFDRCDKLRGPQGDGPSKFIMSRIHLGEVPDDGIIRFTEK